MHNKLRSIVNYTLINTSIPILMFFFYCNKNSNPASPDIHVPWPADTLVYDVTYQPSARIVPQTDVAGCIDTLNSDIASGIYQFVNAPNSIQSLTSGQTVLLEGLDLIKVTSVSITGTSVTLHFTPDSITNLIQDGSLFYRGTVGMDTTLKLSKQLAGAPSSPKPVFKPKNSIKFSGLFPGSVSVQYTITKGAGMTSFDGTAKIAVDPGVSVSLAADGSVKEFNCEYQCNIKNGKITYRRFVLRDVDALLNVHFGGVKTSPKTSPMKFPMTLKIPVPLGLLPTWVSVGWTLEFSSTLGDQSTAIGKGSFTLKGSMGFQETPGTLNLLGEGFSVESNFSQNESEMVSTIKAGMGVVVEFPKIAIGFGESMLQGDIYASMKNELVLNFEPHYDAAGPYPVITGNCFTGNINTGYYIGAETKLLGCLELKTEQQIYAKVREAFKTGKNCQ